MVPGRRGRKSGALAAVLALVLTIGLGTTCSAAYGSLSTLTFSGGCELVGRFYGTNSRATNYLAVVPWEGDGKVSITVKAIEGAPTITFDGAVGSWEGGKVTSPEYTVAQGTLVPVEIVSVGENATKPSETSTYTISLYRTKAALELRTRLEQAEDGSLRLAAELYGVDAALQEVQLSLGFDPQVLQLADAATNEPSENISAFLAGTEWLGEKRTNSFMYLNYESDYSADNTAGSFQGTFSALNAGATDVADCGETGLLLGTLYFRVLDQGRLCEDSLAFDPANSGWANGGMLTVYDGAEQRSLTLTYAGCTSVTGLPRAIEAAADTLLDQSGAQVLACDEASIQLQYPNGVVTLSRAAGTSGPVEAGEMLTLSQTCTREGCIARGWRYTGGKDSATELHLSYETLAAMAPIQPRITEPVCETTLTVTVPQASAGQAEAEKKIQWDLFRLEDSGGVADHADAGGAAGGAAEVEMPAGTYRLEFKGSGYLPFVVILKNVTPETSLDVLEALPIELTVGKLDQTQDPYQINASDFVMMRQVLGQPAALSETAGAADFNGNHRVDVFDLAVLLDNLGKSSKGAPAGGSLANGDMEFDFS